MNSLLLSAVRPLRQQWAAGLALLSLASTAYPFPPYRSTDADTAGAGTVQLRLGLLRIKRKDSISERSTPLTRLNFGVGDHFELVSESEYSPERHQVDEGALGFKWARLGETLGIGVETLVLVPVHSGQSGAGIESQFITTVQHERWQVHFNGGVFCDPRSSVTERGWRGSVLAEFPRGKFRPGAEIFMKRIHGEGSRVQAGLGVIARLERLEVRTGLHFGLTNEAPDIEASVWFAWNWDTTSGRRR